MEDRIKKERRAIYIVFVIIVAVIIATIFIFRVFAGRIENSATDKISSQYCQELNVQMTNHVSSTLDHYLYDLKIEYNALRQIEDLNEEKLQDFIQETKNSGEISYLAFADEEGYVYEEDGSYLGTLRISMLGKLLNGQEYEISDNVTIGNKSYIILGCCFDEGIRLGEHHILIAIMGVENDALAEQIVLRSDYSGGYSSIIHTDGSYAVKNPSEQYGGLNILSILKKEYNVSDEDLSQLKKTMERKGSYMITVSGDQSMYLYFSPIENTEWYIVNYLPEAFIKTSIDEVRSGIEKVYIAIVLLIIVIAVFVVYQQVSSGRKLRKSEENLKKALDMAKSASEAKTSFLFNMSHDIRTPMNAILGYADIGLKHAEDVAVSKDSYQKIRTAGSHLLALINDVLEMSRIESGKIVFNEKPLDLYASLEDIRDLNEPLAEKKSIDLKCEAVAVTNRYVYADELHFNEVIINLLSNAIKYTPAGGKVTYTMTQTGEPKDGRATYRFEVRDTGIGMSEEFQKRLFDSFAREENSEASKIEGTGLGLSIVKKIVDMSKGTIDVSSKQGEGSLFSVEISFRVLDEKESDDYRAKHSSVAEKKEIKDLSGKKVLLAEDNALNREIALYILGDVGLVVDTAEDGKIAVNTIIEKGVDYYDFVLMDIQMPVMNGYEATREIRKLPGGKRIPIIALSANAFEEDKKRSLDEGMNAHVAKPIDIDALIEAMQKTK